MIVTVYEVSGLKWAAVERGSVLDVTVSISYRDKQAWGDGALRQAYTP